MTRAAPPYPNLEQPGLVRAALRGMIERERDIRKLVLSAPVAGKERVAAAAAAAVAAAHQALSPSLVLCQRTSELGRHISCTHREAV